MDQNANTNQRGSFGSNLGFLMSAIGSAVGLGNIWGFPYKMGASGGFTFLLVYLALAVFVGFAIMLGELALGRMTGFGPVNAYKAVSKRFKWIGWLTGYLSTTLMLEGYDVYHASNGRSAIQLASSHCPDLILLDLGLPDMDGIQIITSIRSWTATPIFVVSARDREDDKAGALDLGADDYL